MTLCAHENNIDTVGPLLGLPLIKGPHAATLPSIQRENLEAVMKAGKLLWDTTGKIF